MGCRSSFFSKREGTVTLAGESACRPGWAPARSGENVVKLIAISSAAPPRVAQRTTLAGYHLSQLVPGSGVKPTRLVVSMARDCRRRFLWVPPRYFAVNSFLSEVYQIQSAQIRHSKRVIVKFVQTNGLVTSISCR